MYSEANLELKRPVEQEPALKALHDRFEKQNVWQSECISKIQDRLHQILNRRGPEKGNDEMKVSVDDAISALGWQVNIMEVNCNRLENIFKHVAEIA